MAFITPTPEEQKQLSLMTAPASPQFQAVQHPMHAMIAPIGPPPPDIPPGMMSPDQPMDTSGMSPKQKVRESTPTERYEDKIGQRLMSDYEKDANPYGSENNHPGFFGKFLHGLSVATGGPNRRQFEEEQLGNKLEGIEKEKSAERLQGAQAGNLESETQERPENDKSRRNFEAAQTQHLNDESANLENPAPQYIQTDQGYFSVDPKTHVLSPLTFNGQQLNPFQKDTPEKLTYQTVMGADGKPHTYALDAKGNKVADEGVHYERPITVNTGRLEKNDLLKAYEPTLESAERMNVMTDAYEKAIKNHDQQAMLNLLANHLGMTMGLQKGARLTKDIIHEAQQSQPWLQGIQAHFDKDGYLSGVALSPTQMRQMVNLGQQRYIEDAKKSRSIGSYLGSQDDGPARIPGKATINYYLGLAGGDVNKAKQLATQDGWTVQ